jgi:hypothetical protein
MMGAMIRGDDGGDDVGAMIRASTAAGGVSRSARRFVRAPMELVC